MARPSACKRVAFYNVNTYDYGYLTLALLIVLANIMLFVALIVHQATVLGRCQEADCVIVQF